MSNCPLSPCTASNGRLMAMSLVMLQRCSDTRWLMRVYAGCAKRNPQASWTSPSPSTTSGWLGESSVMSWGHFLNNLISIRSPFFERTWGILGRLKKVHACRMWWKSMSEFKKKDFKPVWLQQWRASVAEIIYMFDFYCYKGLVAGSLSKCSIGSNNYI